MKSSFPHSRVARPSSFTLVELLVVIAIIAILASVVLAAANAAIRMAQRTKASAVANQIQTAINQYYTEYGVYPLPSSANADVAYLSGDTNDWQPLSYALCGNMNAYSPTTYPATTNVANTHAIIFFSPNKSQVDANGIPVNPIYPNGVGPYFNIAIDGNYDGLLGNTAPLLTTITNFATAAMTNETITAGVAIWANCNSGTSTNNNFYVHTY